MADLIQREDLAEAWLAAMELLLEREGKGVNLNVAFPGESEGHSEVEAALDALLAEKGAQSISTVSNTLFPEALYHPGLGKKAAARLYENFEISMRVHARTGGEKDTYFSRLVSYPVAEATAGELDEKLNDDGTFNQLAFYVDRLAKQVKRGHSSSSYEIGISQPADAELRVQAPFTDKRMWSFPCLSHISLTLVDGHVHMCATYRNQTFVTRAYGNYLGLAQLLRFIATESGAEPGEVQVVATHADAEFTSIGTTAVRELIERCGEILNSEAALEGVLANG